MNKKDLIIAVLATFCLTATIFMIFPTKSAEPYNPWADVSGPTIGEADGTINMRDINYEILRFNTFGDTAKNVTIAGHATKLAYSLVSQAVLAGEQFETPFVSIAGYSKVTVCAINYPAVSNEIELQCRHDGGGWFYGDFQLDFGSSFVRTYDAPNEQIRLSYINHGSYDTSVSIDVYLIP